MLGERYFVKKVCPVCCSQQKIYVEPRIPQLGGVCSKCGKTFRKEVLRSLIVFHVNICTEIVQYFEGA